MHLQQSILILSVCALLALPVLAAEQDAAALAQLQSRLAGINSLSGDFKQQLFSDDGRQLEQSSGIFKLLKPGYFSWHITAPDEQLLIAAQNYLWHYDVELETATRRNIADQGPASPLAILGGDAAALGDWYQVEAIDDDRWRLLPRSKNSDFSAIEISFDGLQPRSMTINDALQRRTEISFDAVQSLPSLTPADFDFEPPPGVDVYDAER